MPHVTTAKIVSRDVIFAVDSARLGSIMHLLGWHAHCCSLNIYHFVSGKFNMKIAITSQNRKTITEHAGMCRKFWVYDVQNMAVISKNMIELEKEQSFHEVAHANAAAPHPLDGIALLIAGGVGRGLQSRLAQRGVQVLVTTATDPDQAVADWLKGKLAISTLPAHDCDHDAGHHGQHVHE